MSEIMDVKVRFLFVFFFFYQAQKEKVVAIQVRSENFQKFLRFWGESCWLRNIQLGYTAENEQLETKKAAWKRKHIYTTCTSNFGVPCEFFWGVYKLLAFQSKTQRRVRSSIELGRWSPVEVGSLSYDKFLRSQLVKDFTNSMGYGQCLEIRGPLKSPWNCHRNSILCQRWNSMEILDEIQKLLKHTPSHLYKGV